MSDTKKKTGLGKSAFFSSTAEDGDSPTPENQEAKKVRQKKAKPEKIRTTLRLYPETMAALEMLKIEGKKEGVRVTYSDVVAEAINDLLQKKGLSLK